jgi:hypothetical protein
MSTISKITSLPGFRAQRGAQAPATSSMAFYAAVIPYDVDGVSSIVCRHDSVDAVIARLREKGSKAAFIIPSRLCTKRSMTVEAERVVEGLPLVPQHVLAVNPTRDAIYATPVVFGEEPKLIVVPLRGSTPPEGATPIPVVIELTEAIAIPVAA